MEGDPLEPLPGFACPELGSPGDEPPTANALSAAAAPAELTPGAPTISGGVLEPLRGSSAGSWPGAIARRTGVADCHTFECLRRAECAFFACAAVSTTICCLSSRLLRSDQPLTF